MSNIIQFLAIQKPTKLSPKKEFTYTDHFDVLAAIVKVLEKLYQQGDVISPLKIFELVKEEFIEQKYSVGGALCQK